MSEQDSPCADCLYFDTPADDPDGEPCCTMQYHMDEDERARHSPKTAASAARITANTTNTNPSDARTEETRRI